MSYPNRDIFLKQTEQDRLRKLFDEKKVKPITDFLSKAVEQVKDGKGWAESFLAAAPWMKDIAEAVGDALPFVGAAVKLIEKWLEQTHPFELGAVACTLAYQQAVKQAIENNWTSAPTFSEAKKLDKQSARRLRDLPPAEAADLSTFTRESALNHSFVQNADEILKEMLLTVEADEELRRRIIDDTHDGFLKNLDLLLSDKKTKDKFEPFKTWIELDGGRQSALQALQIHAKYQRDQFESEPLFNREPYALKNIYVNTECGKLLWREISGTRNNRRENVRSLSVGEQYETTVRLDPFSENHGGRHDLLDTVMKYLLNRDFNEPIVIQGVAGAGKSSFTLRLCSELWAKGFQPIRIRLKRLRLSDSLYDAMNRAIELADEAQVLDLPIDRPDDMLMKGDVFKTPYGGDSAICRYLVILDGWDELDLSDSVSFRDKVGEMLREVRRVFLDPQRKPRVRVIVTGRPSPDVTDSKFLNNDTPVLTMRPIRPEQLRKFVNDLDDAVGMTPPYVKVEAWEEWRVPHSVALEQAFKKYEEAFKLTLPKYDDQGKIKEPGQKQDSSLEVLGLPLLAYLTIRVMAEVVAGGGPLEDQQRAINEMVENPTLLYRRLTDLTCLKAGKAEIDERDDPDEIGRQERETGDNLRERLRRTAAAMSVLGQEHISRAEWEKRTPREKDDKAAERTRSAEDHPLSRLMISFYFKGGQPEQGIEFAHKSFREYLFAECIVEAMKSFGRGLTEQDVKRWPKRNYWRDFSEVEDRKRFDFSRAMGDLLAPQWIQPNVRNHLRGLIEWEINRSFAVSGETQNRQLIGLPTRALSREEWEIIRDGLADLWEWWVDGAHMRPQIKTDRRRGTGIVEPAFVEELVSEAAPKAVELDETLQLENPISLDAHLGDALFQLCAWVHYFIAKADGWLEPREEGKAPTPDQLWKGVTARKVQFVFELGEKVIGEGEAPHPFQSAIVRPGNPWRVFAPSGSEPGTFQRCLARVNSAEGRLAGTFPSKVEGNGIDLRGARLNGARLNGARLYGAILDGASLDGASLDGANFYNASLDGANFYNASLNGASLDGASLDNANFYNASLYSASLVGASLVGASLNGAHFGAMFKSSAIFMGSHFLASRLGGANLSDVRNLTREQVENAHIDEQTQLPKEFEQLKQEKLARQRQKETETEEPEF